MSDAEGRVTSAVQICNMALTGLGQAEISSLDQAGKAASLCRLHYHPRRRAVLRMHPWNFATRYTTLAPDADYPEDQLPERYTYACRLPQDYLKLVRTQWDEVPIVGAAIYGFPGIHGIEAEMLAYRVVGQHIFCNESVVPIEYIRNETDVALFDDLFVDLLAARIAVEIAYPLTDNATLAENATKAYERKLLEANMVDAQEGTPRDVIDTSGWLTARL